MRKMGAAHSRIRIIRYRAIPSQMGRKERELPNPGKLSPVEYEDVASGGPRISVAIAPEILVVKVRQSLIHGLEGRSRFNGEVSLEVLKSASP